MLFDDVKILPVAFPGKNNSMHFTKMERITSISKRFTESKILDITCPTRKAIASVLLENTGKRKLEGNKETITVTNEESSSVFP